MKRLNRWMGIGAGDERNRLFEWRPIQVVSSLADTALVSLGTLTTLILAGADIINSQQGELCASKGLGQCFSD